MSVVSLASLAEMDVGSGNAEVLGHRIEFVGGVGQLRQGIARAARDRRRRRARIRYRRRSPGCGPRSWCAARLSPACLRRIEQRIAKTGHRLDAVVARAQMPAAPSGWRPTATPTPPDASTARPHRDSRRIFPGSPRPASRSPADETAAPSARPTARPAGLRLSLISGFDRRQQRRCTVRWRARDRTGRTCRRHRRLGEIQAAAERGDLLRQCFRAERDRLPVKALARDGE